MTTEGEQATVPGPNLPPATIVFRRHPSLESLPMTEPLFPLGQVVITANAEAALERRGQTTGAVADCPDHAQSPCPG